MEDTLVAWVLADSHNHRVVVVDNHKEPVADSHRSVLEDMVEKRLVVPGVVLDVVHNAVPFVVEVMVFHWVDVLGLGEGEGQGASDSPRLDDISSPFPFPFPFHKGDSVSLLSERGVEGGQSPPYDAASRILLSFDVYNETRQFFGIDNDHSCLYL
jgi:hypothetical protein